MKRDLSGREGLDELAAEAVTPSPLAKTPRQITSVTLEFSLQRVKALIRLARVQFWGGLLRRPLTPS
jgi:hypothetical protein